MLFTINGSKEKFYTFEGVYNYLKSFLEKSYSEKVIDDAIKLLESMDYETDFKNYYKNLLNSLRKGKKDLVDSSS